MIKTTLFAGAVMLLGALCAEEATTTILPVKVTPDTVAPGDKMVIAYAWDAEKPYTLDYKAFVHFRPAGDNKIVFGADHKLPKNTAAAEWQGPISYELPVNVPNNIPEGKYDIVAGLYAGKDRAPLKTGDGTVSRGGNSFLIGTFTVDASAKYPTKILAAKITPETVAPGGTIKIEYSWEVAKPFDKSYKIFVHIRQEGDAKVLLQNDHAAPADTASADWKGPFRYEKSVKIPDSFAPGKYTVSAGMWSQDGTRPVLRTGDGVTSPGGNSYVIGSFTVDPNAK